MSTAELTPQEREQFEILLEFVKQARGFDFGAYKRPTLIRRVTRRMQALDVATFADYRDLLEGQPDEFDRLFNTILINVTSFFRDPPPGITWRARSSRGWSRRRAPATRSASGRPAARRARRRTRSRCSSPSSSAIEQFRERVKIYATDVDERRADLRPPRRATTPSAVAVDAGAVARQVPRPTRQRYTSSASDLRRSLIFGRHDLLQDPPISRIDLLLCRNTLMYFNADAQGRILAQLPVRAERARLSVPRQGRDAAYPPNLFTPVDLTPRVFRARSTDERRSRPAARSRASGHAGDRRRPAPTGRDGARGGVRRRARRRRSSSAATGSLVARQPPCAACSSALAPGDLGRPLQDLEVSYRPVELRAPIEAGASRAARPSSIRRRRAGRRAASARLLRLPDHAADRLVRRCSGMTTAFADVTTPSQRCRTSSSTVEGASWRPRTRSSSRPARSSRRRTRSCSRRSKSSRRPTRSSSGPTRSSRR